ncbi:hypothetical protein J3R30DRAFT_3294102 [Lentinula aciculospora]|uniref:Cyclin N-terminal domain-containing protein n=1 Tax=Lentinula aciculospora TaxID=153920 RepID=A0A9W9DKY2_9AGAR|nr:hypothetical protein J3R30DRAFT_3294102 [Lentinula aciculospora]
MFNSSDNSPPSSSSSSIRSPVHHASLVDPSTHSPDLLQLVDVKPSRLIIDYVVDCVADTVDFAMGRSPLPPSRRSSRRPALVKFTVFVTNVITRAEVTMPIILSTLAYIDRAKPHLHIALEEWALERVFLGALILASKYSNDSTLKNIHWALCTGVFGKRDVGRIEREFLDVLNWELSVSEENILAHYAGISAAIAPSPSRRQHQRSPYPKFSRHHVRNHSRSPCPTLEPSSPLSSSEGTSSPQTPSTSNSSPDYFTLPKVAPKPQPESVVRDWMRSFPIPSYHAQESFSIQV